MKLRHHDLQIPDDGTDPFVNCKLERKKYADVLTCIVESYADGFVLAINNPWGEGKTTFVKMWRQDMINNGFQTLYYNAWENDFESDVLIALISELGELKNKPEQKFKDVLKNVVPLTSSLLPSIGKHLAKRLVGVEAVEDFIEAIGEYTEIQLKEATNKYTSRKKSIQEFKDSLESFVIDAGNGKPIVFMIDELDRCRPNYAVEVLEQIKHLFSVPGIVFVLSIDKIQLGHAVRGVYGSDKIDADEYLRRFIDLEYSIPDSDAKQLCEYLYSYYQFDDFFDINVRIRNNLNEKEYFITFTSLLINNFNINFRQAEKIFAQARLALRMFKETSFVFPSVFILLIYLKLHEIEIYKNIQNKKFSTQELIDKIEGIMLLNFDDDSEQRIYVFTIVAISQFYHNYINENRYNLEQLFIPNNGDENNVININSKYDLSENKNIIDNAFMYLRQLTSLNSFKINTLLKKIDLLENINI